jgi:hypothetical protein
MRRWRQRDIVTLAAAWRRRCGGGAQRNGGSAVAAARWMRRWRQRDIVTSAAAWRRRGGGSSAAARQVAEYIDKINRHHQVPCEIRSEKYNYLDRGGRCNDCENESEWFYV